ncbi:terminal nucleotidyltransferase 4B-like [Amphibalanus amphitrite]|nr:terminal nucleotidyltransferase 4B-like [Amphibalanus amphitrite]
MHHSPAASHIQQNFIRLSGPPDGGWRQRPGGGPAGRGRRGAPGGHPYLPRRSADRWGRNQRADDTWDRPGSLSASLSESETPPGRPWIRPDRRYSRGVVGLHEEIEDFFQHISPTVDEHHMRTTVFENIKNVIHDLWKEARVFIFGSFETGLYLPTSDIDVVVIGKWRGSPLEMLKDALVSKGICSLDSVKVLDKATVPIIKLTDRRSQIKVDISFNMTNGLVSANRIKQLVAEFPHMSRLVMVLKQFLLQRELNEVFTGGVSSYAVILMVVSFLQTHERPLGAFPGCNLGVLLIEFFELYGVKFNYHDTCIRVREGGYAPRSEVEDQFIGQSAHSSPLCIEDPHNPSNDIGRSSYHVMKVKEAFRYAYHRLRFAVLGRDSDPNRASILGRVVTVPDEVGAYRRWVAVKFPSPDPPGREPTPEPEPESEPEELSDDQSEPTTHLNGRTADPAADIDPPFTPNGKALANKAWWTPACAEAVKARGKAKKAFRRYGTPEATAVFKRARMHAKRVLKEAKEAFGGASSIKKVADGERITPTR